MAKRRYLGSEVRLKDLLSDEAIVDDEDADLPPVDQETLASKWNTRL